MSRDVIKQLMTPNGDTILDDTLDAVKVSIVGGSISVLGSDGAIVDGINPLIRATVKNYTNSKPVAVVTVDTNGDPAGAASGLTDAQLRATPVPVSGTFFQATQPVSIAAAVPVTDNAGSLTVDGTVAATQSGTWTVQPGNTANTTAWKVDGSAVTQPVSGTFWQATQPISATNLDVALSTRLKPADTLTAVTTVTAVTAITNALPAGTNRIGSVRPVDSADADLTAAKGTQTSRAVGVQDLKDSGRTNLVFYAVAAASGTTGTETLITLTKASGTAATTTGTSFVITNGKTWRISNVTFASQGNATATTQTTTFALRINTAGAVIASSTPLILSAKTQTPATTLAWDRFNIAIPDGLEFAGNGTIQFGVSANAVFVTNAPTWHVIITGFEY